MKTTKFHVSDACVQCQKCVVVCPLNNVRIENKRPYWEKHCTHCMACINVCPKKCIDYGEKTKGKNRYFRNEYLKKA